MDLGKVLNKDERELQEILFVIREEVLKALRPADEVILDDVDLRALLKISERTTAELRGKNLIAYSKPGKVYYLLSDVLEMMKEFRVEAVHDSFFKSRIRSY